MADGTAKSSHYFSCLCNSGMTTLNLSRKNFKNVQGAKGCEKKRAAGTGRAWAFRPGRQKDHHESKSQSSRLPNPAVCPNN